MASWASENITRKVHRDKKKYVFVPDTLTPSREDFEGIICWHNFTKKLRNMNQNMQRYANMHERVEVCIKNRS